MSYCLVPMTAKEIQSLVGPNFISSFHGEINPVLAPLIKYIKQGRPASMGKELWEYAVADSIQGAVWSGAGKSIVDVCIGDSTGIDVKSLQKGSKSTTEASMYQYLQVERVAEHFQKQDKQALWDMFVGGWLSKVRSVPNYYLLGIIKNKETLNCHLVGFRAEVKDAQYLDESCDFSRESMKVKSLADPELIDIKVYKGKTRMEMRIKDKVYNDPNYSLEIYKGI
jgi:hypothetical protein